MEKIVAVEFCTKRGYTAVMAEFGNGEFKDVVFFYNDELTFSKSEFIGLTANEAGDLHHRKDVAYLRS